MKLLNITSFLYIFPLFQAWKVNHTCTFRYGMGCIIIMSQIYHSTYHPLAKVLDMTLVHYMVVYHIWSALYCGVLTWKVLLMYLAILYSGLSFWILKLSRQNDWYHAVIHLVTTIGSYLYISEQLCIKKFIN